MAINSCVKGKVYERELATQLRAHGFTNAKRGQQHKGGEESPDVMGLPGFHIEAKRVEALSLYDALAQAERDAGLDEVPLVVHRRNGKRSVAIIDFEAFLTLVKKSLKYEEMRHDSTPEPGPKPHDTEPLAKRP